MSRSGATPQYSRPRWRRKLAVALRPRRLALYLELTTLLAAILIPAISYLVITGKGPTTKLLTPELVALLLVANLVPIIALLVLLARRIARRRAARSQVGGSGRLHVRLVAVFSVIASVPTLLVVIFASFLFQSGVEFWFSDRAKTVLESADGVAQSYVSENRERIIGDIIPMAGDIKAALGQARLDDPRFSEFFAKQVAFRVLSEAAIVSEDENHGLHLIGGANLDRRPLDQRLPKSALAQLADGVPRATTQAGDRVEAVILLDKPSKIYLYISRHVDPKVLSQVARARSALGDYNTMIERSRALQLRFNAALLIVSLLIIAAVIWIALTVADRLVRPLGDLVDAARKVTAGDMSARVALPRANDEVGTLANTFNRMTRRLEEQTSALVTANSQLETRRAFTEAVLSGVSAGVISINADRIITLLNSSAARMLGKATDHSTGVSLSAIAPELDALLDSPDREQVVQLSSTGDPRTLAVTVAPTGRGHVLTFDDITERLSDQRRAAWADVARRIAHEIKNPLTPIQLAAERLQRRYGKLAEDGTFEKLTDTIIRQVGDLRRMVDEFSSFARMPKPLFREEAISDIARQALFLHEVAHPSIQFEFDGPETSPLLVCDRRQLGQALINIVKNAVEAIEARGDASVPGAILMTLSDHAGHVVLAISDNGIGLPVERERLTEPYMTTRARGTGLGLAIVKKIVEEHQGTITFTDRVGGGTVVNLDFVAKALSDLAVDQDGMAASEGRSAHLLRTGNDLRMALEILVIDDEQDIRELVAGVLEDEGYQTRTAADSSAAMAALVERRPSLVLLDVWLQGSKLDGLELLDEIKARDPSLPVLMISGHGNLDTAVAAVRKGAVDFIEKPFEAERLLHLVARATETERLRRELASLRAQIGQDEELTGNSSAINAVRATLKRVAPTGSRVLISGPAGVGKEVAARLLHQWSPRASAPFVVVSAARMTPERIEEELFGVEENGQLIRPGLFEQAHGGTLFLDEIADMPLTAQGKVLRVLTDQSFTRIGGQRVVKVDVRVVSATSRNLTAEIEGGRFREDLYYRLNVVPVALPELSARREDIPPLVDHFVARYAAERRVATPNVTEEAIAALQAYDWPGNVRQLRNIIERTIILAPGDRIARIDADMLPPELLRGQSDLSPVGSSTSIMGTPLREARETFEREYLRVQIRRFSGNISRTATFIGMERSALHRKLKALGLADPRAEEEE